MTNTKWESEFEPWKLDAGSRCWQVDNDRLEHPLEDGEWETQFAEALVDLAEAHDASVLTCAFHSGASVDFGHPGSSVWIAISGSGPLVRAAGDLLREIIPSACIRASGVDRHINWVPRIRISGGKVWRPHDGSEWIALSSGDADPAEFDEDGCDASNLNDQPAPDALIPSKRRKKVLNAARNDVSVGYYQRKIERLLSLPEGSVKLVNPDRSISHPAQLVGSLRGRWESA